MLVVQFWGYNLVGVSKKPICYSRKEPVNGDGRMQGFANVQCHNKFDQVEMERALLYCMGGETTINTHTLA